MGLISLQEQFVVVFLNSRQHVIGWRVQNIGSMETCVIDIRLLASLALHCMASYVIIANNHPTGTLQASINDKEATMKIKKALRLIDVFLLDHLILSADGYLSMRMEGMFTGQCPTHKRSAGKRSAAAPPPSTSATLWPELPSLVPQ